MENKSLKRIPCQQCCSGIRQEFRQFHITPKVLTTSATSNDVFSRSKNPLRRCGTGRGTQPFFKLFIVWIAGSLLFVTHTNADEFTISLKSGSVFTVQTDGFSIDWTDVQADGSMKTRQVDLNDVQQLVLSDSPVSEQVAKIRSYLTQLSSPDYLERETAEEQLSDNEVAGRFRSLIKAESDSANLEIKHRIGRILEKLEESNVETGDDFDSLTFKDGTRLQGDAGDLKLNCNYRNQRLTFTRSDIRSLAPPSITPELESKSEPVNVEVFHSYEQDFLKPHQTLIDFEQSPRGEDLPRNTDVSDMFVSHGVLMDSEAPGFVGVSGYGFRFPMPPKENSVSVFQTMGPDLTPKKFEGVMEFRFCLPNQRFELAGVHEFGLFIARVDQPRDFIVEAYNSEGQILATVESSDLKCVFAGVKSTEPITLVRVLSNPYLFSVLRKIDEDYAVDNVCFSPPVAVTGANIAQSGNIRLRNGDLLNGDSIVVTPDSISIKLKALDEQVKIPLADVKSIRFETQPQSGPPGQRNWLAMLTDRSVVAVEPQNGFKSSLFNEVRFEPEQLAGLWFANNKVRFPMAGDFDSGKYVMVFPTCRLVSAKLNLQRQGYDWTDSKKMEQDLWLENNGENRNKDVEDPTPQIQQIDYGTTSPELIPTLWWRSPQGRQTRTGLLRLVDGQQFVVGGTAGFSIKQMGPDSLTLALDGKVKSIPFTQILSVEFP